jgi:hypothetical protein
MSGCSGAASFFSSNILICRGPPISSTEERRSFQATVESKDEA